VVPGLIALGIAGASCGGPEKVVEFPRDTEYARLELSARGAFERGEFEYARDLYNRQLLQAERSDRPLRIGNSEFNLAVCEIALGNTDRAQDLLNSALIELGRAGEPLAPVYVVLARAHHLGGDPGACLDAADLALLKESGATRREQVEALALRGLSLLSGQVPATTSGGPPAAAALRRAEKLGQKLKTAGYLPVSVLRLRARVSEVDGKWVDAAHAYEREAEASQARARYDFMSEALELAGNAWLAADDPARAGDRLLRAARSRYAYAVGREVPARRAIEDLAHATRLCQRVFESGAVDADPSLESRLAPLVARIQVEEERVLAVLAVVQARDALDSAEQGSEADPE